MMGKKFFGIAGAPALVLLALGLVLAGCASTDSGSGSSSGPAVAIDFPGTTWAADTGMTLIFISETEVIQGSQGVEYKEENGQWLMGSGEYFNPLPPTMKLTYSRTGNTITVTQQGNNTEYDISSDGRTLTEVLMVTKVAPGGLGMKTTRTAVTVYTRQ